MTDQTMSWLSPANVSRNPTTFRILRMVVRSRASNRISSARLTKELHVLKVQEDLEAPYGLRVVWLSWTTRAENSLIPKELFSGDPGGMDRA